MDTPLINGVQHSWAQIRMNILGREVTGVTKISYDDKDTYENNYGAGDLPDHRGKGNYEAKASIELYGYEVNAIQKAAKAAGLSRMQKIAPFDITVSWLPDGNAALVTDIIKDVQFMTNARDISQGDTSVKVPLELIVSMIQYDA